jgi:hypothetical protein
MEWRMENGEERKEKREKRTEEGEKKMEKNRYENLSNDCARLLGRNHISGWERSLWW